MAENNTEVEKVAINDIGTVDDFIKAVDSTIKNFDDGDLVEGTVVKVDHDEVLLDIGYKTEGVIPSRELSIKKDVDPDDVVKVGDTIEALVVTKEDKEGRSSSSMIVGMHSNPSRAECCSVRWNVPICGHAPYIAGAQPW